MTITGRDVSDELFARLREHYTDDAIVELTEVIAWENASSKFNRALRIPSQGLVEALTSSRKAAESRANSSGDECERRDERR
jgi:hypothetical protein